MSGMVEDMNKRFDGRIRQACSNRRVLYRGVFRNIDGRNKEIIKKRCGMNGGVWHTCVV